MRLTGGASRGKVLSTPSGNKTRPTDARTREMLFNMLGAAVVDARVLDLYAGSGAVGLEALSRGAASCVMVEQSKPVAALIRRNLENCGYCEQGEVWPCSVTVALRKLTALSREFDLIFADPPFHDAKEWIAFAQSIDKAAVLLHNSMEVSSSQSLLVVQHPFRQPLELGKRFEKLQERRAGESVLSFFTNN